MPSQITRDLLKRGRPRIVVAIGMHHPGGGLADRARHLDGPPPDLMGPEGPPDGGGEGERQRAYEQVTEGLQMLAGQYPEAKRLLAQFESLWAGWMGEHAASQAGPDEESPEEDASEPGEEDGQEGGDQAEPDQTAE